MGIQFRILGPLEVLRDGVAVQPTSAKQRVLLAVLVVRAGEVVPADTLVDAVWPERPPATATGTLQNYISQLRKAIDPGGAGGAARQMLVTAEPGYRLVIPSQDLDAWRFERLLAEGRAAMRDGRAATAVQLLAEGLALWRGPALADVADVELVRHEAQRLDALRVSAVEAKVEAHVALGRHHELVAELEGLVAVYPLRERLWALLMVCLYRTGRQADALAAFQQLRHRLADELGLEPSSELVQLEHDILRHAPALDWSAPSLALGFPPLHTPAQVAGNLPAAATSFVGHGEELERLATELPLRRLITLTGVGGVGKTRLALEAGWIVADKFPDGVWMCQLAPFAEPAAVAHAVAAALSIRLQEGLSLVDSVVDALRGRRLLVVLDNCEHLLDAAAELVGRVTESCPTVTVLATSREPLGVAGERIWAVPSLPATEGVRLFCERAEAADASFSPAEGDLAVIAEICERLDGIPLAIELAAARVRLMTAADLAERLQDRFRLLRGGRRGLERHHTLAATVQWSYRLLPEAQRLLFDRLSVFAGGFTLPAAEAVCADDRVERVDVADHLGALVDKSMVVADRAGAHARYQLLETLRQFGEERLDESAQAGELRDRHLRYFLGVAHEARRDYEGRAQAAGAATLRSEWANIRAAVHWAITQEDRAAATGFLDALFFFAYLEERYEFGDWASQALTVPLATPTAYGIAAMFAGTRGEYAHALSLTEAGLAAAKSRTEPETLACWLAVFGANWYLGRREQAGAARNAMLQVIDPSGEPFRACVTAAFSTVMTATGADPDSAGKLLALTQRLAAPLDNPALDAVVAYATGAVARSAGHYESASEHYVRALALAERSGNLLMQGMLPMSKAFLAVMADAHDAERSLLDAVRRLYEFRDWINTWPAVEALALYWMKTGHLEDAAVLLGHLQAHGIGHAMFIEQRRQTQEALADTPDAHRRMSRGARLDRDELIQYVLATHGSRPTHQDNNES